MAPIPPEGSDWWNRPSLSQTGRWENGGPLSVRFFLLVFYFMPRIDPAQWRMWSDRERLNNVQREIRRLAPSDGNALSRQRWNKERNADFPTARHVTNSLGIPWGQLTAMVGVNGGKQKVDLCECGAPATQVRRFRIGGPDLGSWQDRYGRLSLCDRCAAEFDELEENYA